MFEKTPKVVRAERFELVNAMGEPRAILSTDRENAVSINFLGRDGVDRLALGTHPDGSTTIALQDQEGKERVKLSADNSGSVINIKDEQGTPRAQLQMDDDGGSELILLDQDENPRLTIAQVGRDDGLPRLSLRGSDGAGGIYAQVALENKPMIGFLNEDGEVKVVFGLNDRGSSTLAYQDDEGEIHDIF